MSGGFFSPLTGSLLIAHPSIAGDVFRHGVVYLSAHSQEDGAVGFLINVATGKTLGDLQTDFAFGALGTVPLYCGGPVGTEQMSLGVFRLDAEGEFLRCGIPESAAQDFVAAGSPHTVVRAFAGYAGWSAGQLESECMRDTWAVCRPSIELFRAHDGDGLWRALLFKEKPEWAYLADAPEDLSLN